MSKDQLLEKIKKELLKSGFPLELNCRKAIMQHMWMVDNDRFYLDDKNSEREIDAMAFKQALFKTKKSSQNILNSCLIVECKKNESNHWVFFCDHLGIKVINVVSTLDTNQNRKISYGFIEKDKLLRKHHYFQMMPCTSYCMAFKISKERNQIFEGMEQLFSAYSYSKGRTEANMKKRDPQKGIWVNVYYPVLVFHGRLFMAELAGEDIEVKEVKHLLYTSRHPSYIDTWVTIDIVSADFFAVYLVCLEQDQRVLVSYIKSRAMKKQ